MSVRLTAAAALYSLFLAAWSGLRLTRDEGPDGLLPLAAALLESIQVLIALAAAIALLAGWRAVSEPPTFAGYLLASVLLIPLTALYGRESTRWDSAAVAAGFIALAVVDWRLTVLWEG